MIDETSLGAKVIVNGSFHNDPFLPLLLENGKCHQLESRCDSYGCIREDAYFFLVSKINSFEVWNE